MMGIKFVDTTKSLCPVCLKRIDAEYVTSEDKVYMQKKCMEHGEFQTLVWSDLEDFIKLNRKFEKSNFAVNSFRKSEKGCPFDCGICENHKQASCCVLFEVTKKCNLNCPICFADAKDSYEQIKIDEIYTWFDFLLEQGGPFNIQLSGGEPTLRNDLDKIIQYGLEKGFDFFQLNTNGLRIGDDENYIKKLKDAGLNTVFLQFDGFLEHTYQYLRGKNILKNKLIAIENCRKANIAVVLVPTIKKGINDHEIGDIIEFAIKNNDIIKGVHFQPISFFGRFHEVPKDEDRFDLCALLKEIEIQTKQKMKSTDFFEGNAEHSLCSFHGDFLVNDDFTVTKLNVNKGGCCSSDQARKNVSKKWTINNCCQNNKKMDALDAFIHKMETKRLSISAMGFQDVWNIDLNRLQKCYINIYDNKKLIPFCAYNITAMDGNRLYRK